MQDDIVVAAPAKGKGPDYRLDTKVRRGGRSSSRRWAGLIGHKVQENVCRDCWQEWRDSSAQLINHYGLALGNPAHRQQLRVAMREFLNLDEDET